MEFALISSGPWPMGLIENPLVETGPLSSHGRVTDSYLLALAREYKAKLATLDPKLATEVVTHGKSALALI
jgi:hypothetical protein